MRTKNSKLPSAKPQIALLAMALVISSGAVYAQAHRGQVSASNPTQAVQSTQSTQSVTTSTNSSFTQPAPSTSKGTTHSHRSTLLQIVGGAHGDDDGENGDD
jgi:cytoskeletal protein RodZ